MAIGIRSNEVYFFYPPTPTQVVTGLQTMTGLSMGIAAQEDGFLELFHPEKPTWRIEVSWSTDRLTKLQLLFEAVPDLPRGPFLDYPHCISLTLDPRPAPRSHQYLEASLLLVFQRFGGKVEHAGPLPSWAGKKWADMPPLGLWEIIKDRRK